MTVQSCVMVLTDTWGDSAALSLEQARAIVRLWEAGDGGESVGGLLIRWYGSELTRDLVVGPQSVSVTADDIAEMRKILVAQSDTASAERQHATPRSYARTRFGGES